MKREVTDYLIDFDKYLGNDNGILHEDGERIKRARELTHLNACAAIFKYKIDNIPAYLKYKYDTNFDYQHAYSIATSKIYNGLGLINSQVFPIHRMLQAKQGAIYRPATITQDIRSIKSIRSTLGADAEFLENAPATKDDFKNKWSILYNKDLRDYYLQYMTEDCFDDFINYFLLGELRTDDDGHAYNYFFYKSTPHERKFEGFIPIDMDEGSEIMDLVENKGAFNQFLHCCYYSSYTPFLFKQDLDFNYKERLTKIKELIHSGHLTQKQIDFLRRAINYNLPQEYLNACKKYNFGKDVSEKVDGLKYLWDYNHKNLDREL